MLWLWIHIWIYLEINPDLSGFLSIPNIWLYPDQFPDQLLVLCQNIITKTTKVYIVGHCSTIRIYPDKPPDRSG